MTECRQLVLAQKTGKYLSAPKLCSLPPTSEAFKENLPRAHLQVAQWRAALNGESPAIDPIGFGWEADQQNESLIPRNMSSGTPYSAEHVLKLVRCGCHSERSCRGGNCGCMGRQLLCMTFCPCLQDSIHSTNHMKTSRRDESWNHIYREIILSINHSGYHTCRWIGLVCICWMMTHVFQEIMEILNKWGSRIAAYSLCKKSSLLRLHYFIVHITIIYKIRVSLRNCNMQGPGIAPKRVFIASTV